MDIRKTKLNLYVLIQCSYLSKIVYHILKAKIAVGFGLI